MYPLRCSRSFIEKTETSCDSQSGRVKQAISLIVNYFSRLSLWMVRSLPFHYFDLDVKEASEVAFDERKSDTDLYCVIPILN
jgi:hypothetical protein